MHYPSIQFIPTSKLPSIPYSKFLGFRCHRLPTHYKTRAEDETEDRNRDEGQGEDVEHQRIYFGKMNK
jgi:hypothetical protein